MAWYRDSFTFFSPYSVGPLKYTYIHTLDIQRPDRIWISLCHVHLKAEVGLVSETLEFLCKTLDRLVSRRFQPYITASYRHCIVSDTVFRSISFNINHIKKCFQIRTADLTEVHMLCHCFFFLYTGSLLRKYVNSVWAACKVKLRNWSILSRVWVTIDGVWIGDSIYWPLIHSQFVTTLYRALTQKLVSSVCSRFLATDFDTGTITVSLNYTVQISHIKFSLHSRTFNWAFLQRINCQSKSHIATDGQSVSHSVLVSSPMWGSWPDIYYLITRDQANCSTNFYLLFHTSSTHVRALSQFVLRIFLLSPAKLAWSRVIK
jgi:hypothetical protein